MTTFVQVLLMIIVFLMKVVRRSIRYKTLI